MRSRMGLIGMVLMSLGVNTLLNSDNPSYAILKIVWAGVAITFSITYLIFGAIYLNTGVFIGIPISAVTIASIVKYNTK